MNIYIYISGNFGEVRTCIYILGHVCGQAVKQTDRQTDRCRDTLIATLRSEIDLRLARSHANSRIIIALLVRSLAS